MQVDAVAAALAQAHRSEWAFVLSATVRVAGDLDVAEECAQEAYVSALRALKTRPRPEVFAPLRAENAGCVNLPRR